MSGKYYKLTTHPYFINPYGANLNVLFNIDSQNNNNLNASLKNYKLGIEVLIFNKLKDIEPANNYEIVAARLKGEI